MLAVVALWAFAEATLFFVVADVPISAIGLRHGTRRALVAALVATFAAALGGLVMLAWAAHDPQASRAAIEQVPGIGPAAIDRAAAEYARGGTLAILGAAFRGVPYKLFAQAAGMSGAGMARFFLVSCIARLPRFALVALGSGWLGTVLRPRMSRGALAATFFAAWTLFYVFYFLPIVG